MLAILTNKNLVILNKEKKVMSPLLVKQRIHSLHLDTPPSSSFQTFIFTLNIINIKDIALSGTRSISIGSPNEIGRF